MRYGDLREAIAALIAEHPGISSREISERLGIDHPSNLSVHTSYLRDRQNRVRNEGKDGRSFLWYPVTQETEDSVPYIQEARDILDGFWKTPVAHRERYLANRLQQLVEGEI